MKVSTEQLWKILEIRVEYIERNRQRLGETPGFLNKKALGVARETAAQNGVLRNTALHTQRDLNYWTDGETSFAEFCAEVLQKTGVRYTTVFPSNKRIVQKVLDGKIIRNAQEAMTIEEFLDQNLHSIREADIGQLNAALADFVTRTGGKKR